MADNLVSYCVAIRGRISGLRLCLRFCEPLCCILFRFVLILLHFQMLFYLISDIHQISWKNMIELFNIYVLWSFKCNMEITIYIC